MVIRVKYIQTIHICFFFLGYFCGTGIGNDQASAISSIVDGEDEGSGVLSDGPFILTFNADKNPGMVAVNMMGQNELGFSLEYRISSSCPDLDYTNAT